MKKKIKANVNQYDFNPIINGNPHYESIHNYLFTEGRDDGLVRIGLDREGYSDDYVLKGIDSYSIFEKISGSKIIRNVSDYVLERFLARLQRDDFYLKTSTGYYGDQWRYFCLMSRVEEKLKILCEDLSKNKYDSNFLIERSLIEEYGYLLPTLQGMSYSLEELNVSSVYSSALNDNYVKLNRGRIEYCKKFPELLSVLCLKLPNNKNRLIDGRHRLIAAQELGKYKITAIIVHHK